MRPRDAISYVNLCLEMAYGKDKVRTQIIKEAEKNYSKKRLNALFYEWFASYPCLDQYIALIKNKPNSFTHSSIKDSELDELALSLSVLDKHHNDPVKKITEKMYEKNGPSKAVLRNNVLRILYSIGILGVKKASYETVSWSQIDESSITESETKNSTHFEIHPMLHSALGVNDHPRKHNKQMQSG